ncbi:hypothetical protein [Niabella ginsengisoli]|uniref:Translation elongation factor KOW-like domain-containing protein n=1 Tax=Niabella ginsengisoli TaxID=522298 RepID=A0ABS9SLZ3_9BACT|nr:hypothetical protein [Niabella ginsengisoli]MCH5599372.1 hypothetical protein [Niabella ginsengisoli]
MANTSDISRGMILKLDGSLYSVVEFGENKTARAAAKVWAKLKGVDNSRTIEKTWNSGDTIHPVRVEKEIISISIRMRQDIILWTTLLLSK